MDDQSRVRVSGPLASFTDDFAVWLADVGYTPGSAAQVLRRMARLSEWIEAKQVGVGELNPLVVEAFLADRHARGRSVAVRGGAFVPLLEFLRVRSVLPSVDDDGAPTESAVEVLLARYRRYLEVEHGLAAGTITRHVGLARAFLTDYEHDGLLDVACLAASAVTAFVVAWSRRQPGSTPHLASALRSLLRFLYVEGDVATNLVDAVPSVARRRLAGLPKALPSWEVAAMLASCDRDTAVGRRDLAILTMYSRMGLRVGEVVGLRLDDIDWRGGELAVRGKGNRSECLPLPVDVGAALVAYLVDARPVTDAREVFVRARAPYRAMSRGAASNVAASAARRAGLATVYAHRLRHSAATAMLAGGASLDEIGQVLRHRHRLTTAIYAKVDYVGLRSIARPWPGVSA